MTKHVLNQKHQRMLMLGLGTVSALALIWYALVDPAKSGLKATNEKIVQVTRKLNAERHNASLSDRFKEELDSAERQLRSIEERMPEGDLYRWLVKTLLPFKAQHNVEFASFEPPQLGENRWPNLPYKSSTFSVLGAATYHNFGKFLADLENTYPYFALRALELDPAGATSGNSDDDRTLRFRMEFVTPVKPAEGR